MLVRESCTSSAGMIARARLVTAAVVMVSATAAAAHHDSTLHKTERNTHLHLNLTLENRRQLYDDAPLPRCGLSRNRRGKREAQDGAAWHFYYSERLFSDDRSQAILQTISVKLSHRLIATYRDTLTH
jgi:hypothetical protein